MTETISIAKRLNGLVLGGVALVVLAVALYLIDADPAILFENLLVSLIVAGAGAGMVYVGWRKAAAGTPAPAD